MNGQTTESQLTAESLETIGKFGDYMARAKVSFSEAGEALGCSASRLHQTLKLTYSGDVRGLCRRMEEVLAAGLPEGKPAASGFVMTSIARDVIDALHLIRGEGVIGVILGASGIGKTAAARFYAHSEGREIVYELVGPGGTPHSLLNSLASRLGTYAGARATQYDLRQAITEKVGFGDYLLLLDDADLMVEQSLQSLRIIADEARVGICFIGTLSFLERLRARRRATMSQFLSRIGFLKCLGPLSDADIARIAESYHLGDQAKASLIKYAGGSARRAMLLLQAAVRIGGERPGVTAILEAMKTLLPDG